MTDQRLSAALETLQANLDTPDRRIADDASWTNIVAIEVQRVLDAASPPPLDSLRGHIAAALTEWNQRATGAEGWPAMAALEAAFARATLAASPPTLDRLRRIEAAAHALVDDDGFTKDREREWRDLEAALKEPSDD